VLHPVGSPRPTPPPVLGCALVRVAYEKHGARDGAAGTVTGNRLALTSATPPGSGSMHDPAPGPGAPRGLTMPATALATKRITISDHIIEEARDTHITTGSTLVLRSAECSDIELPADLQRVLLHTHTSIAGGGQITIGRMPEELTSTVAADLLGVSRPTLMKWARAGEIDSFTVGSHTRFTRDEVLRVRALRATERSAANAALHEFDAAHDMVFDD